MNEIENTDHEEKFESRLDLEGLQKSVAAVKEEVAKVIVGQHSMVDLMIAAILCNGHVLIEGVPGIAKTLTAKLIAKTIDAEFKRIQFTPDLMPSDVLGTSIFNPGTGFFEFKSGPIFANLVLIDEINRAPAKTQSALFEVMEERHITIDGNTYSMAYPFMIFATQNPIDHEGTYSLPEAELDRFIFKIDITYPNLEEEIKILELKHTNKDHLDISNIKKIFDPEELMAYKDLTHKVVVEQKLLEYIAKIVTVTRTHSSLFMGASPRASIALLNSSKAFAAMNGRDFVIPDDIKYMSGHVLRHRIIETPEKEMEGISRDEIIKEIIEEVEVPR